MSKKKIITGILDIFLIALTCIYIFNNYRNDDGSFNLSKIISSVFFIIVLLILFVKADAFWEIPKEADGHKKLIFRLSKNDFKTQYAGSYMGIIWAFVQPVVTVVMYWFVFEKALHSGPQMTPSGEPVPYVLWLMAGLLPWFYFASALPTGTGAMTEYSYLVKKVVFPISILPVIKVISNLFVHLFFIVFAVVFFACSGWLPSVYIIQIIYYLFCMMAFVTGLIYFTCAVNVFFRDITQIINILMQVFMWFTPILWNIDSMFPEGDPMRIVFELNPMYYIVTGYRDALINQVWFTAHPAQTIYFWAVTLGMLGFGMMIFRRLKVHFADVL